VPEGGVFDTTSKYVGEPDFRIPAALDDATRQRLEEAAVTMFRALDCRGLARVDFFVTGSAESPRILLNEVNTFPGFTSHSQVPRMFAAAGVPYGELLEILLETALVRSDGRRIRNARKHHVAAR
jgi:D-alanine-D-alanine ligase